MVTMGYAAMFEQFTPSDLLRYCQVAEENGFGSIILGTNGLKTNSDAVYFKLTKTYSAASPWSIDATYTYTQADENRQFGETYSLDFAQLSDYPTLRS